MHPAGAASSSRDESSEGGFFVVRFSPSGVQTVTTVFPPSLSKRASKATRRPSASRHGPLASAFSVPQPATFAMRCRASAL